MGDSAPSRGLEETLAGLLSWWGGMHLPQRVSKQGTWVTLPSLCWDAARGITAPLQLLGA